MHWISLTTLGEAVHQMMKNDNTIIVSKCLMRIFQVATWLQIWCIWMGVQTRGEDIQISVGFYFNECFFSKYVQDHGLGKSSYIIQTSSNFLNEGRRSYFWELTIFVDLSVLWAPEVSLKWHLKLANDYFKEVIFYGGDIFLRRWYFFKEVIFF